MSAGDINYLAQIWDAYQARHFEGSDEAGPPFGSAPDLYSTIDSIPYGDIPWEGFQVQYEGAVGPDSPGWMSRSYDVWFRDPLSVMEAQIANPEFVDHWDYAPKQLVDAQGTPQYIDLMSGEWAWEQAVRKSFQVTTHSLTDHFPFSEQACRSRR